MKNKSLKNAFIFGKILIAVNAKEKTLIWIIFASATSGVKIS